MTEVDREMWDEIQREIREGTPNTPERVALFRRADAAYARMQEKLLLGHPVVVKAIQEAYERGRDEAAQAWEDSLLDME